MLQHRILGIGGFALVLGSAPGFLGCAEGATNQQRGVALSPQQDGSPVTAGAGPAQPEPGASADACEQGEAITCACDDGIAGGVRKCVLDATSPRYGFLSDCTGCGVPELTAPDGGPADAGGPLDAGTVATDGGSADADVAPPLDRCGDGSRNDQETDVDCGGPDCDACAPGAACVSDGDCQGTGYCDGSTCVAPATPTFRNYDHAGYSYAGAVAWDCAGTTRFDSSGAGSWVQTSPCSDAPDARPEVSCGVSQTSVGGAEVCILRARGFVLGAAHRLELVGDRPVIIAVEGNATIAGAIDASADGTTPGAGGNWSCASSAGGAGSGSTARFGGASGGGGGGFGSRGGAAGTADTDDSRSAGGVAGTTRGNAILSPLVGGCAGGSAGDCSTPGGAGGGAVQVSASGALLVTGEIWAVGADGDTPCGAADEGGGTGGGSGGAILLEGGSVDVSAARLEAGGGSGGRNGAWAGIYHCGDSSGGGGSTSASEMGGAGTSCQGGSSGGGGGFGRIAVPQ